MPPFRKHILICTHDDADAVSCSNKGSQKLLPALEKELRSGPLDAEVLVSPCSCLGLCDEGPIVVIYPDDVWYRKVTAEDVPEIVSSHLRAGQPVSRLAWTDVKEVYAKAASHRGQQRASFAAMDQAGVLPNDLNQLLRSFMSSRVVLTALELDVFTAVGNGASAEHIARVIATDTRATEMLLNALVSLKLLEKRDATFCNTARTTRFFREGSKDNARGGLLHVANLWRRWSTMTDCVRTGKSAETRGPGWINSFIDSMDYGAKARVGVVVSTIGDHGIRRLLDLGGGSGAYSIAFARALPELRADILDVADVIPLTQANIDKAGLANRITTRVSNLLLDPLGQNYDLILASQVTHAFSPEENQDLFRRAFLALAPNGRMVVQDFILDEGKTSPRAAVMFSLSMLAGSRAGSSHSESEYTHWLREAGFTDVRRLRPSGLIVGVRA